MGENPAAIREQIEQTRERMGETVDALGYKADVPARAKDSIGGKVEGAKDSIGGKVEGVKARLTGRAAQVSEATPDAQDVKQAGKQAVGVVQENPLGLAIGATAVGFLAGMLIPSTKVEDEHLGQVSDQVKDQARETGHEAIEHGRDIVQETAQTAGQKVQEAAAEIKDKAQESTQQHAQELGESAMDSAQQVQQAAQSSAQR